jgi:sugar lactone lactonase YvrE
MQFVATIPVGNVLGECVLWDDLTQSVWWTDIEARTLHRLDWRDRTLHRFVTPRRLASFGFVEGRREVIAAFDNAVGLFDPMTGAMGACWVPEGLSSGQRMNDGRVDHSGRFWVGSMMEAPDCRDAARLYCVRQGRIETRERGLTIANGICWSPDAAWCYLADSGRHIIWRYRFDAVTGTLGDRQEFAVTGGSVFPDGATVDAEGYLWSAQWGGGRVVRYAPDGRLDRVLEVPVSQPSCVAFGGADFDLLFMTSARSGLASPQTGAGDLFVYNVGVRGLPESRFKFYGWPETLGLRG